MQYETDVELLGSLCFYLLIVDASIVLSVDQWNYLDKDFFLAILSLYLVLNEKLTNCYW